MKTEKEKLILVEKAISAQVKKNAQNEVIIEDHWVQVTTPNAPVAYLNGVLKCILPEEEAESRISQVISSYKRLNLPFRFKISPSSRPKNLGDILSKHHMKKSQTLYGLYTEADNLEIAKNPDVEIRNFNLATLEDWLSVQSQAWAVPPEGIAYLREQTVKGFQNQSKDTLDFIAYYKNQPVASAGLRIFDDYALLVGAAVSPEERGKGIYRSLLAHRMDIIKKLGLPAVIHCLEKTSAPICLKLGFEKVCEIYSFEYSSDSLI